VTMTHDTTKNVQQCGPVDGHVFPTVPTRTLIPAYDFGPVGEGVTFLPKAGNARGHVPGPKLHDSTDPDCRGLPPETEPCEPISLSGTRPGTLLYTASNRTHQLAQPTIFRNLNQNTLDLRANRNSSKYFRFKVKEQFSAVSVHAVNTTEKTTLYVLLFLPTVTERHSQASQVMGRSVIAVADRPTHTHGSRKPKGEHVAHEPEACTLLLPCSIAPRAPTTLMLAHPGCRNHWHLANPSVPDEMDQLVKRKKYRRNTLGFLVKRVVKVRLEIL
jgi:hypothetical protein